MLWEPMDKQKRWPRSSIAEVNIDIFQNDSLMFPIIKRNHPSQSIQTQSEKVDEKRKREHSIYVNLD